MRHNGGMNRKTAGTTGSISCSGRSGRHRAAACCAVLLIAALAGCATTPGKEIKMSEAPPMARIKQADEVPDFSTRPLLIEEARVRRELAKQAKRMQLPEGNIHLAMFEQPLGMALIALIKDTPYSLSFGSGFRNVPITFELNGVSLGEAFEQLLEPIGLEYTKTGDFIVVDQPRSVKRYLRFDFPVDSRIRPRNVGSLRGGGTSTGGASSETRVDIWRNLSEAISLLVFGERVRGTGLGAGVSGTDRAYAQQRGGRILIIDPRSGTVLIEAPQRVIEDVDDFLRLMESSMKRQVLIEARLMQVSLSDQFVFGLDLDYQASGIQGILAPLITPAPGTPDAPNLTQRLGGGTGAFRIGVTDDDFTLLLDTLKQIGKVDLLSSPKIATLNNQVAEITVVTEEVFYTTTPGTVVVGQSGIPIVTEPTFSPDRFSVGIHLAVLPQISEDNHVTMRIVPSITSLVRIETSPSGDTQPVLDRKELTSIIRVQSGETVVMGGLIDEKVDKQTRGVPLLQDIPLLGFLFKRTEDVMQKRELVLFLTPTVMEGGTITRISEVDYQRLKDAQE